jgi:hypothetical protein
VAATLIERDWMEGSTTRGLVLLVVASLGVLWLAYSAKGVAAAAVLAAVTVPVTARRLSPLDAPAPMGCRYATSTHPTTTRPVVVR